MYTWTLKRSYKSPKWENLQLFKRIYSSGSIMLRVWRNTLGSRSLKLFPTRTRRRGEVSVEQKYSSLIDILEEPGWVQVTKHILKVFLKIKSWSCTYFEGVVVAEGIMGRTLDSKNPSRSLSNQNNLDKMDQIQIPIPVLLDLDLEIYRFAPFICLLSLRTDTGPMKTGKEK